jgi:hypothetical protein
MLLCFPASTFFIKGFTDNWKSDGFSKIMALLFVVVMVIFFIVQTKIVHYSSLMYVPGCYFAALTIHQFLKRERTSLTRLEWSLLGCSLIVYLILTLVVPMLVNRPELITPFIHNLNVVESISQNIHWPLSGFFPGIFLFLSGIVVCYLFYRKSIMPGMKFLIIATMIFTNSLWAFYLPLLEKYLQGDLIQYYKEVKDQPIDLTTYKYKTYAHMFYAGKKVFRSVEDYNQSAGRQPNLHIITRKKDQSKIEKRYAVNLLHNFGQFLVYEYIP